MSTKSTKGVRKLERPRPLRSSSDTDKSPSSLLSAAESMAMSLDTNAQCSVNDEDLLMEIEMLHVSLNNGNYDSTIQALIANVCEALKVKGATMESSFQDQMDCYFVTLRNASRDERLDAIARLRLLEVIELRASGWKGIDLVEFFKCKFAESEPQQYQQQQHHQQQQTQQSQQQHPMAPVAPATSPPLSLQPTEVLKSSGKFGKPAKIPGRNFLKDEIVIRNSDSGKVMGIKGRRVHMIEELSDTVISFQRVNPGVRDRLVQITGPSEETITRAKELIEDTIRRNASPVREMGDEAANSYGMGAKETCQKPSLVHSYSMGDASIGEYTVAASVGRDTLRISGHKAVLVKAAKQFLEKYLLNHGELSEKVAAEMLSAPTEGSYMSPEANMPSSNRGMSELCPETASWQGLGVRRNSGPPSSHTSSSSDEETYKQDGEQEFSESNLQPMAKCTSDSSDSVARFTGLFEERHEPEVWVQNVQSCLHHLSQQKLTGATAGDFIRCGPILKEYAGDLRMEIPHLALLRFLLNRLHHPLCCTAGKPRVQQLQDPGPEALWDHHPGTPKDRVLTGHLRHSRPGDYLTVRMLQHEQFSWLWNSSRHLWQRQPAQGISRPHVFSRTNSFNITGGRSQAGLGDHVSQVFYTRKQEHALFPPETSILKSGQNIVKILHVVSIVNTGDEDILLGDPARGSPRPDSLGHMDGSSRTGESAHPWLEPVAFWLSGSRIPSVQIQFLQSSVGDSQIQRKGSFPAAKTNTDLGLALDQGKLTRFTSQHDADGHSREGPFEKFDSHDRHTSPRVQFRGNGAPANFDASVDAARPFSPALFVAASIASAAFTTSSSGESGSSWRCVCMPGLFMLQAKQSRSKSSWSPKDEEKRVNMSPKHVSRSSSVVKNLPAQIATKTSSIVEVPGQPTKQFKRSGSSPEFSAKADHPQVPSSASLDASDAPIEPAAVRKCYSRDALLQMSLSPLATQMPPDFPSLDPEVANVMVKQHITPFDSDGFRQRMMRQASVSDFVSSSPVSSTPPRSDVSEVEDSSVA
nr:uncharacterized protein LOC119176806 [Rhipicephalus microplus]